MTNFTDPTSTLKVDAAFQRYLRALERNETISPGMFEDLTQEEREDLQALIEVFDLAGAVGCSTTPSAGFLAGVRARLYEEQRALKVGQVVATDLFGAVVESIPASPTFGPWLKQKRLAAQRALQEVARDTGCKADLLADIEGGAAPPSSLAMEQWRRLAAAIPVGLADLWERLRGAGSFSQAPMTGMARSTEEQQNFQDEYHEILERARRDDDERRA